MITAIFTLQAQIHVSMHVLPGSQYIWSPSQEQYRDWQSLVSERPALHFTLAALAMVKAERIAAAMVMKRILMAEKVGEDVGV